MWPWKGSEIWVSLLRPPVQHQGSQSLGKLWTVAHWRCRLTCPLWSHPLLMTRHSPAPPSCPSHHTMRISPGVKRWAVFTLGTERLEYMIRVVHFKTLSCWLWADNTMGILRNTREEVAYRWVLGEANFLSAKRQNIHQLLSGSFLYFEESKTISVLF